MKSQFVFVLNDEKGIFPLVAQMSLLFNSPQEPLRHHQATVLLTPNSTPDCVFHTNPSFTGTFVGTRFLPLLLRLLPRTTILGELLLEHEHNSRAAELSMGSFPKHLPKNCLMF